VNTRDKPGVKKAQCMFFMVILFWMENKENIVPESTNDGDVRDKANIRSV